MKKVWFNLALLIIALVHRSTAQSNGCYTCNNNNNQQQQVNPCSPNPCYNYGICSSNDGVTFKCTCSPNYAGVRCENPVQNNNPCPSNLCGQQNTNPCANNPCQNGGTCLSNGPNSNPSYFCQCPINFTGTKCEIYVAPPAPVNPCQNNPCQNGGTCRNTNQNNLFYCQCPPSFTGIKCDIYIPPPTTTTTTTTTTRSAPNPCLSNPCAQGSTCLYNIQNVNSPIFMCICPPNMQGKLCNEPKNPCPSNTCGQTNNQCQNGGTYRNGYCVCPVQYTGSKCEILVQQNPCQNPSICGGGNNNNNQQNNQVCSNNPCQNGGTCIPINNQNANPPFACVCNKAFTGLRCEIFLAGTTTVRPTQPPNPCFPNPCQNGRCLPMTQPNSVQFVCICDQNFSGTTCNQYNPPTTQAPPNPCLSSPCQNGGSCVTLNIPGVQQYACLCNRDYTGKRCETQLNTCQCFNGGNCRNNVCICPVQYTGSKCEILVQQNPCQNPSICGGNQQTNPCSNSPCQNGGICEKNSYSSQGFICLCPSSHSGTRCELSAQQQSPCGNPNICGNKQPNDPCSNNPCKNGATCRSNGFSYQCDCVVGFVGNQCETRQLINLCATNTCYNGGTCETQRRDQDQYTVVCFCPPEYTGSRCQISVPALTTRQPNVPLPCQCMNDGVCNSGSCQCQPNFYGSRCEFQNNYQVTTLAPVTPQEVKCPNKLCINGRCAEAPQGNGFYCICNYGWTGTRCTIRNFCQTQSAQCKNGGICLNDENSYSCKCQPGYEGTNCENKKNEQVQILNPCGQNPCGNQNLGTSLNPCQNGGSSYSKNGNQMCQCPRGYIGLKCEVDICKQPILNGPCKQSVARYHYNSQTKSCETFHYSGCGGNENNFGTLESCNFNCLGH
ncbi:unnamed protein product [Brachionus calyciflorus]|uniref:Uncharacterized protein n=1 Tax=Brachionus calyciflorus TaxID=104777 RepID=A0A814HD72_9BILA|nr:unnamed protein product [Brachionus calyciflorus]